MEALPKGLDFGKRVTVFAWTTSCGILPWSGRINELRVASKARSAWGWRDGCCSLVPVEALGRLIAMSLLLTYSAAMTFACDAPPPSVRVPIASSSIHSHDHDHAHDEDMSGVAAAARPSRHEARSEWKAKCLCGCSDTHFQPGHGTARLGSVVPGTVVARLVEVSTTPVPFRSSDRPSDLFLEIDPVPI